MSEKYDKRNHYLPEFLQSNGKMVLYRLLADRQAGGDIIIREAMISAHLKNPLSLRRHLIHNQTNQKDLQNPFYPSDSSMQHCASSYIYRY